MGAVGRGDPRTTGAETILPARVGWIGAVGACALVAACGSEPTGPPAAEPPPGRIAFAAAGDLWTVSPASGAVVRVTATAGLEERFSWRTTPWSPDGSALAYMATPAPGEVPEQIWVAEADGSNPVRLTDADAASVLPDWSPDGRALVFSRWVDAVNQVDLFVVDVSTGAAHPLVQAPGNDFEPEWSPVAHRVAYLRVDPGCCGGYRLYSVASDGSDARLVLDGHNQVFAWSPGGERFATHRLATGGDGNYRVAVASADGSDLTVLTEDPDGPDTALFRAWSRDGAWVAWGSRGAVHLTRRDGSETRSVLDLDGTVSSLSWSPDGSWMAFVRSGAGLPGTLWLARSDGSSLRQIEVNGLPVASAHWSPAGPD